MHGFELWVASLMANHYHVIGYVGDAKGLGEMMRKIHGSVAKLTNDLLTERRKPFWRERGGRDYFDGCLRDVKQLTRAYGYTLRQSVRHTVCADPGKYPHTKVWRELNECVSIAVKKNALMQGVPYARYRR
jgi:hypothetical protein